MNDAGLRRGLIVVAFGALLCLSAWRLNLFAHREFAVHLRDQAAEALALAATGETPYHWSFATADDLVARHPFDADDFAFDHRALRVQSNGHPFEVGLRLERPIDLHHFPRLHLAFNATAPGELYVVLREQLDAPEHVSSPIPFASGHSNLMLNLGALPWRGAKETVDTAFAPKVAAMLRMRFSIAPGITTSLSTVALQRAADYKPLDITNLPQVIDSATRCSTVAPVVYRLAFDPEVQKMDIANIVANGCSNSPTLVMLPQRGRVEQKIVLRNAVYSALPAAILIPENALDASFAEARDLVAAGPRDSPPRRLPWSIVGCYALILLLAGFKPPQAPKLRAMLEIALVLVGPAWLILGGNYDGSLHAAQIVLMALTLAYAVSLSTPRSWHWNGERRAWLLSAAVVAAALILGMMMHSPGQGIATVGFSQIARYLAWALLQQYLICVVCAERWRILTGRALWATYLGALGFALLHTPNAALMLATFAGGLCWCAIYLRYRALLPLALSHVLCALLLVALLPTDILHSAEVSARFFQ